MLPNIPGQPESKMFVKNPVLTSYRHNFVIRQSKSVTIYGSIRYGKKMFWFKLVPGGGLHNGRPQGDRRTLTEVSRHQLSGSKLATGICSRPA